MSATYRSAIRTGLPDATVMVDHFHVVQLANKMLSTVRRRTTAEVRGRRGRASDPEWKARRRLLRNREDLADEQFAKMWNPLLAEGKIGRILLTAWIARKSLRNLLALARTGADRRHIGHARWKFLTWCADSEIPEIRQLAITVDRWWSEIEAFIDTGHGNAKSEGINRVIKLVARAAFGFRNADNTSAPLTLEGLVRLRSCGPLRCFALWLGSSRFRLVHVELVAVPDVHGAAEHPEVSPSAHGDTCGVVAGHGEQESHGGVTLPAAKLPRFSEVPGGPAAELASRHACDDVAPVLAGGLLHQPFHVIRDVVRQFPRVGKICQRHGGQQARPGREAVVLFFLPYGRRCQKGLLRQVGCPPPADLHDRASVRVRSRRVPVRVRAPQQLEHIGALRPPVSRRVPSQDLHHRNHCHGRQPGRLLFVRHGAVRPRLVCRPEHRPGDGAVLVPQFPWRRM